MEDLEAAGLRFAAPPPSASRFATGNAEGMSWDGQGEMPAWLRPAFNAGQGMKFFRAQCTDSGQAWSHAEFFSMHVGSLGPPV
ncbi:hypothetical protein Tamer19_47460 [Cupriavidus sp. TA19]|nr:hypothetical protein Tamer19_47460 [Cupriavidus sp. TA19]